jgi:ADP-heptose:LPS heptosyltransferase
VHLTDQERAACTISGPFAVVSPLTKPNASPNKQWGLERWEEAINGFPLPVYQLGPQGTQIIRGALHFVTPTMRHAAAVVERAAVVMTNEGGMHHLAASMRRPAVVVFGGFMPVHITGYSTHINLGVAGAENYCGSWTPCEHCKKAMAAIAPDVVKQKAISLL